MGTCLATEEITCVVFELAVRFLPLSSALETTWYRRIRSRPRIAIADWSRNDRAVPLGGTSHHSTASGPASSPERSGLQEPDARVHAAPAPVQCEDLVGGHLHRGCEDQCVRELDLPRRTELGRPAGDVTRYVHQVPQRRQRRFGPLAV